MRLDLADNHFALFGISPCFHVDLGGIETRYCELQSLLHPDRYAAAGRQERRLAAQGAALVNQAHAVLIDDCARAAYLLELRNVSVGGESGTLNDHDFLMEQMELRESIEQSGTAVNAGDLLRRLEKQVASRMLGLCEAFNEAYIAGELDDARELVYKMQFIKKIHAEILVRLRDAGSSAPGG